MHHRSSAKRPVRAGLALTAALAAATIPFGFQYSEPVTASAAAETAAVAPASGALAAALASATVASGVQFRY
jgi:hypothetical protein